MKVSFVAFPIISIISLLLGIIVLIRDVKSRRNIYFFFLTIFISIWIVSNFLENENIGLTLASLFLRIDFIVAPLVSLFFILFCLNFPEERKISVPIKRLLYLFALFFVVAAATDLIVKDFSFEKYKLLYSMGVLYPLYAALHISYMGYGAFILLSNIFRFKGLKRHQSIYVFLGFFISSGIILILNLILEQVIFVPREIARFGIYGLIIFEGLTAYAITKHRLMDIRVVISRTAAWLITVGLLGSIYLGLVWLYRTFISPRIDLLFLAWTILYGILVGETFQRIRLFLQTTADKAFVKGWYDYRKVQRKISSDLRKAVSLEDAVKVIRGNLDEELDISQIDILLPDRKVKAFIGKEFQISMDDALIKIAHEKKDIISREDIPSIPLQLVAPCFSNGELSALIMLGKKRSEDPYNDQDLDLLRTLSDEISDTLLRIRPYEEAKQDLVVAERELERTHRLAALGTLAAGVAHEIRNPMAVIRSRVERGLNRLADSEFVRETNELILKHIDRLLEIVNRMLKFAKIKEEGLVKININKVLEDGLALLEGKIKDKSLMVAKEFKAEKLVLGNPDDLFEAFLNIILNGIDFMSAGGALTVGTRDEGRNLMVEIKDTGAGIPADKIEHIFDPFFTTRAEGVGLGLSISYKIIKNHGGEIKAASEMGRGSTFTILLPAA
jgi:signal transduction histidine kinase